MAIQWSSFNNNLRVGIEVTFSPASPNHDDTTVSMTLRVHVGCSGDSTFADNQTMTLSGYSSTTVNFFNDLLQNQTMQVYTRTWTGQAISYSGGPTRTWTASISGAYDGSAPSKTASGTLPARPAAAPLAPGTPSISNLAATSATISWSTPSNEGSSLTQRQIQISTSSGFGSTIVDSTAAWGTSYNATGLAKGTTYYVRVRAINAVGAGAWSATQNLTTLTTVPNALATPTVGSITSTSATVTYAAPSDTGGAAIAGYQVQRASDAAFTSGAVTAADSASPYELTDLAKGATYYVRVRAQNSVGWSAWSLGQSFTTSTTAPGAPAQPTVDAITSTSASVGWTAPVDTGGAAITGYDVQSATDPGFTADVVTTEDSASPHGLTDLLPGTTYYVRVRAKSSVGDGDWSPSRSFATLSGVKVGDGTGWADALVHIGDGTGWVLCEIHTGTGSGWS